MKTPHLSEQAHQYWSKGKKRLRPLIEFFQKTPGRIDRWWRWWDFGLNRNYAEARGIWKAVRIKGYSIISFGLPVLAFFFLVSGPRAVPGGYHGLAIFFGSWICLVVAWHLLAAHQCKRARWNSVAALHVGFSFIVMALVWGYTQTSTPGADRGLYRHTFLVLGFLLYVCMLPAAYALALCLFRKKSLPEHNFREALHQTELFQVPALPAVSGQTIVRSLINAPLHYPLFLIFIPALVIVFISPAYWDLRWLFVSMAVAGSWLVLSFPTFHERIRAVIELTRRCLFVGGQFFVSAVIIVLAMGRLFEFGYIATVVEASRRTILLYLLCSYSVFWFYEYWMNRILTERILGLFQREGDPFGSVIYEIEPQAVQTSVPAAGRTLEIHGAARFIAVGGSQQQPVFEPYERAALFDMIARTNPKLRLAVEDIKSRMKSYFNVLNILLVVSALIVITRLSQEEQEPQVSVLASESKGAVDLRDLMFGSEGKPPSDHVILLAASGGGTRAALYTASVLHGLAELGELENVVLASGVSGGGAALAYYAAHKDILRTNLTTAWSNYYVAMSQPFIQEVLEGATEWRINRGLRLGKLLEESFLRHLELTNASLGGCTSFGLIFNSSLAGHLWQDSELDVPFRKWANENRQLTRSDLAGGRLIFTNLRDEEWFPRLHVPGSFRMKYVVVRGSNVPLAAAAALNANFPPVFSNAAVDKDGTNRFWITDGGATDNRGVDALLFALRGALRDQEKRNEELLSFPVIHIIIADASASSIDYQQDRGMGSKFGAPEKFATQLMEELVSQIDELCQRISGTTNHVRVQYLTMPNTLRMRGGLGTHWMLPLTVKLSDANERDPTKAASVRVDSDVVLKLISELHQTNVLFRCRPSAQERQVSMWVRQDEHTTNWMTLKSELEEVSILMDTPQKPTMILESRQTP